MCVEKKTRIPLLEMYGKRGDGIEYQFDFWIYLNVKKGTLNLLSLLGEGKK